MPELKGRNFLIVDDEQTIITIVREVLKQLGAHPFVAMNIRDGMKMALREELDAIILDRYLGKDDGHTLLQELKSNPQTQSIPVIMLTGESKVQEIQKSVKMGASGYVVKPFTPKGFLAQLDKILRENIRLAMK